MGMRWGLALLLLAPFAQADQTATIRWTAPVETVDGTPLRGKYALTRFRVLVDGKATTLPASASSHKVTVASGQTISVNIQACHASRCSALSPTIRFPPAGGAPPPEPDPEPGLDPAPDPSPVGANSRTPGQLVWSGIGQGSRTIDYGWGVLMVADATAVTVNIRAKGATQGTFLKLFPFKIDLVNGRVRAQWRDSRRPESHIELINPLPIGRTGTQTISFTCDLESRRWSLVANGSPVSVVGPRRCLSEAWGRLQVAGAGGEAKIDVFTLPGAGD